MPCLTSVFSRYRRRRISGKHDSQKKERLVTVENASITRSLMLAEAAGFWRGSASNNDLSQRMIPPSKTKPKK